MGQTALVAFSELPATRTGAHINIAVRYQISCHFQVIQNTVSGATIVGTFADVIFIVVIAQTQIDLVIKILFKSSLHKTYLRPMTIGSYIAIDIDRDIERRMTGPERIDVTVLCMNVRC